MEYFSHEDSCIWDYSLQALCFFPSVIHSLGNLSRGAHTDRQQCKEKREQGRDTQPWEHRGPRGRRAVLGVPWVPAGIIHPHPAPLAAGCCYWSCRGKRKPKPMGTCSSHQPAPSPREAERCQMSEASHCVGYSPAGLLGPQ